MFSSSVCKFVIRDVPQIPDIIFAQEGLMMTLGFTFLPAPAPPDTLNLFEWLIYLHRALILQFSQNKNYEDEFQDVLRLSKQKVLKPMDKWFFAYSIFNCFVVLTSLTEYGLRMSYLQYR